VHVPQPFLESLLQSRFRSSDLRMAPAAYSHCELLWSDRFAVASLIDRCRAFVQQAHHTSRWAWLWESIQAQKIPRRETGRPRSGAHKHSAPQRGPLWCFLAPAAGTRNRFQHQQRQCSSSLRTAYAPAKKDKRGVFFLFLAFCVLAASTGLCSVFADLHALLEFNSHPFYYSLL
jgi:hypothetical protein